jgi:hypothetical protein
MDQAAEVETQTDFSQTEDTEDTTPKAKKGRKPKLDENGEPIVKAVKEPKAPKLDVDGNPIPKAPAVKIDDTHIIILTKPDGTPSGNPKRPGTNAHAMFELYKDGQTVAQYVEAGGGRDWVRWDVSKGYITLG